MSLHRATARRCIPAGKMPRLRCGECAATAANALRRGRV